MSELKFTKAHEWLRLDSDGTLTIGISNYAQEQLGDVVYVELPEVGRAIKTGDDMAVVESVKTAGEIKAPVSGTVTGVNERLANEPEIVNSDPLGDGWFFKMKLTDPGELDAYMDEAAYEEYLKSL